MKAVKRTYISSKKMNLDRKSRKKYVNKCKKRKKKQNQTATQTPKLQSPFLKSK